MGILGISHCAWLEWEIVLGLGRGSNCPLKRALSADLLLF